MSMGWTSSWTAVENTDVREILSLLGVAETGELLDEWCDPGLCWLRVGTWVVVLCDGFQNHQRITATEARALSAGRCVLHLEQSDFSMCDSLTCYLNGAVVWEIDHRAGELSSPSIAGDPPPQLAGILTEYRKRQAAADPSVDYLYEVVPELGRTLTGFRHDDPRADDGFHVVA
jgi:hypothetical protein